MSRDSEIEEARTMRQQKEAFKNDRIRKRLEACVRYKSPVVTSHIAAAFSSTAARVRKIAAEHGLEDALEDVNDSSKTINYYMKKKGRGGSLDRYGGTVINGTGV